MTIATEAYEPSQRGQASHVLAEAFITNPALVRSLGTGTANLRKARRFYDLMLRTSRGEITVARDELTIVGVMQVVDSRHCQPGALDRVRLMPAMLRILGRSLPNAVRWFGTWGRHDPDGPHQHLGPIGVLPERQGQGIGTQLLQRHIDDLDRAGQAGYLETDKEINIRLYERLGYRVTEELPVLGVPTWLMWRDPR